MSVDTTGSKLVWPAAEVGSPHGVYKNALRRRGRRVKAFKRFVIMPIKNETCFPQCKHYQSHSTKLPSCRNTADLLIADVGAFSFPTWNCHGIVYFKRSRGLPWKAYLTVGTTDTMGKMKEKLFKECVMTERRDTQICSFNNLKTLFCILEWCTKSGSNNGASITFPEKNLKLCQLYCVSYLANEMNCIKTLREQE